MTDHTPTPRYDALLKEADEETAKFCATHGTLRVWEALRNAERELAEAKRTAELQTLEAQLQADMKCKALDERDEARKAIAKGAIWTSTEERSPDDAQTVIGYWPTVGICTPFFESVTYYARDALDGPEAWRNAWGEETDAPHYWMPQSGLPEPPK